jgi:DNA-binding SARP family transcriptional activator/Tfp pilus assembly protein PilF
MIDSPATRSTNTDQVMFRILGPLEVEGSAGLIRIPPGRQEVILACLLLEANRVVGTGHLVDLIWNDEPPDTARAQVQICVSRIRKSLGAAGVEPSIISRAGGYQLRTSGDQLDLHTFSRQVGHARALIRDGQRAQAAETLRAAVALWRGGCLSGIPCESLRTRALRLDEDRLAAMETYLDLELELGRHHELVGELSELVHEYPLRERTRGQLMLALYRSGRQAEALEVYRSGRTLLIDELGLEPGEELRLLETAILAGDPALNLTAEARRGQGDGAAGGAEPVLQQHLDVKPQQLPADTADFVGAEAAIGEVEEVLLGGDAPRAVGVAVIVGKPGIGKSTMAVHVAHRLSDRRFPDGQLYCDLRGTSHDPVPTREVLGRFLRALGIPGPVIPDSTDERAEMYRTLLASRRALVVLDDAAAESQIAPLLPGSGNCAVLVTSRYRLTAVPGAETVELDVLGPEHSLELLARVVGHRRVAREPDAAEALFRTVGGLPLALRIVAARLAARPHWTLASMVHRLANERHSLDELAHGEMTIRASLSLTHDGLNSVNRRLMRLLSLAEGPTLPGWLAGALLDDHRPVPSDLLEPLVDVQMLDVVAVETTGEFRYRFHEVIRLFAREQLPIHDSEAAQRAVVERMIGGWLALAERAHARIYGGDFTVLHGSAPRWQPPADYVNELLRDPLRWLDAEQENLCSAVDQAARYQLDEACWDLAMTLVTLFEARGYFDQWERTHRAALDAVERAGNRRGRAAMHASLGTLYLNRRQPDQARAAIETALDHFDDLGDVHGLALCRRDLGLLERQCGDDDRAMALYEQAARDFEQVRDTVGRATVLTQSAHILMRRGHSAFAFAQLEEALEVYRAVGFVSGEAHALRRVGQVMLQLGEHDQAERALTQVLSMVRRSGDVIGEGHLLRDLGQLHADRERYAQAREFFDRALAIREQIMDHGGAAAVRLDIARLRVRTGDADRAREPLEQAIATFTERNLYPELREARRLLDDIVASRAPTS